MDSHFVASSVVALVRWIEREFPGSKIRELHQGLAVAVINE